MVRILIIWIGLTLYPLAAPAQVPSTMSITGTLTNANGDVVTNATYYLNFKLYDDATLGDTVWTELDTVTTAGGIFQAILGDVKSMANLEFAEPCWIEVEVSESGDMSNPWTLDPRLELTATAFSLNARKLVGQDDAVIKADSNEDATGEILFQIGANTPLKLSNAGVLEPGASVNDTLRVTGIVRADKFKGDGSLLSNISGTQDSDWTEISGNAYRSSGYVGIGTSAPETALSFEPGLYSASATNNMIRWQNTTSTADANIQAAEISGQGFDIYLGSNFYLTTAGGQTRYNTSEESSALMLGRDGRILFFTGGTSSTAVPRGAFLADGKFGVGTTTPDHLLELGTGPYSEIDAGETQFTTTSHSSFKENFAAVDKAAVVAAFEALDVQRYNFKATYLQETHAAEYTAIDQEADAAHRQALRDALDARLQQVSQQQRVGLMADDFYAIAQALNPTRADPEKLSGDLIQSALVIMVQELMLKNAELEARIAALEGP